MVKNLVNLEIWCCSVVVFACSPTLSYESMGYGGWYFGSKIAKPVKAQANSIVTAPKSQSCEPKFQSGVHICLLRPINYKCGRAIIYQYLFFWDTRLIDLIISDLSLLFQEPNCNQKKKKIITVPSIVDKSVSKKK